VFKKSKKALVYFLIVAIPFICLFLPQQFFVNLKTDIIKTGSWPIQIVLFPFREIKKIIFYHKTYNDFQDLKQQVDPLLRQAWQQQEVFKENVRLRALLDLKHRSSFSLVAAHVIMRDPANWSAAVIIDKGTKQGVRQGMPVITPSGVVGKIAEVGDQLAKITLLTDPRFSVAASVERTRDQGVVSGTLKGTCRLQYLPVTADVQVGDIVVTSKISSFFPEGLLIGRIINVQESFASPTLDCLMKPAVVFSQLEEVFVVTHRQ